MSGIGPELPAHLLNRHKSNDSEEEETQATPVGPTIPAELLNQAIDDEDEDEDDYAPALPPDMLATRSTGPSLPGPSSSSSTTGKRVVGPSIPSYPPTYDPRFHSSFSDDDDDDFGPKPLPAGVKHAETDAVKEFMEREEKRRKEAEVRSPIAHLTRSPILSLRKLQNQRL